MAAPRAAILFLVCLCASACLTAVNSFPVKGVTREAFVEGARARRASPRHTVLRRGAPATAGDEPKRALNVYDFGAKGDGTSDDTGAFQAALNTAGNLGGIVEAPEGEFRIDGSIVIPESTALQGSFLSVPSHAHYTPNKGTVFLSYGSRSNESATPLFTLQRDSALRGVTIFYPEQAVDKAPEPYPWSIDMVADNAAVEDVECLNCYNAIRAVNAGRHYIARVQGQPINIGLYIDSTYDIGRVEDVHWNPWYSDNLDFVKHQLLYGKAFVVARSDWEYFFNTFAFGYNIGYQFVESSTGACNGNFLGIGMDLATNVSVLVEAAQPMGLLITNGEFTAFVDSQWIDPKAADFDPTHVRVLPGNDGAVRFVNSAFWGPANQIAVVDGSGTVGFSDCALVQWDGPKQDQGRYAIQVTGTGKLVLQGNDFQQDGNQVHIDSNAKAVIVGNTVKGDIRIKSKAPDSHTQIGLNL